MTTTTPKSIDGAFASAVRATMHTTREPGPTVLASCPALQLELRTDTQHATAYLGERPAATVHRGRAYTDAPAWSAYDTEGQRIATAPTAPAMVAALRRHFLSHTVTRSSATGVSVMVSEVSHMKAAQAFRAQCYAALEANGHLDTGYGHTIMRRARDICLCIVFGGLFAADLEVSGQVVGFKAGRVS